MARRPFAGRSMLPPWASHCDWSRIRPASRPNFADTGPRRRSGVCPTAFAGSQAGRCKRPTSATMEVLRARTHALGSTARPRNGRRHHRPHRDRDHHRDHSSRHLTTTQENTMGIIAWIVLGLAAGAIAKAILPGDDPGGFIVTAIIGVAGALAGGFLAKLLFNARPLGDFFHLSTWGTAIIRSIVPLGIYPAA